MVLLMNTKLIGQKVVIKTTIPGKLVVAGEVVTVVNACRDDERGVFLGVRSDRGAFEFVNVSEIEVQQ